MKDIADLKKLIEDKKIFLLDDDDIRDRYNILDVKIKNLKPRESAFSIISKGYIILIPVLLMSTNGILLTLLNLFRIGDELLLPIILSILFWIGVGIVYFQLEEPLSFVKQSINSKLTEIKNELTPYMILQVQVIEVLLERNILLKYREKIKREKDKIEKYLNKREK